jgi:glycosyltransferase involved in cell wall biosynthesis
VHVIYCENAFELVRGDYPLRAYEPHERVTTHGLRSRWGSFSPLWTQQTGGPGPKWSKIRKIINEIRPDVVHFHNLSLIGGPGLLRKNFGHAVRLMTAHEHWLVCPMHVLWQSEDRLCEQPSCHKCSIGHRRPPQLWRHSGLMEKGLGCLDRLIVPSQSAAMEHQRRGIRRPIDVLPYFLPSDWPRAFRTNISDINLPGHPKRPYFTCVGRIEKIKGFQDVIALMDQLPEADLRIAGHGSYLPELRKISGERPNVIFEGLLEGDALRRLVRGSRATIVPSLVPETFGYVVLESFAQARPVIGRNLGALPEILNQSEGGIVFQNRLELMQSMKKYLIEPAVADSDGLAGQHALLTRYDEQSHLATYLSWVDQAVESKQNPILSPEGNLESEIPEGLLLEQFPTLTDQPEKSAA